MVAQRSASSGLKVVGKPSPKMVVSPILKKPPVKRSRRPQPSVAGLPAKHARAEAMVRDIRSRAESLLANADRLLSRLS
jgi:hypothetical protein